LLAACPGSRASEWKRRSELVNMRGNARAEGGVVAVVCTDADGRRYERYLPTLTSASIALPYRSTDNGKKMSALC
jgi:hypothetical protein